MRHLLVTNDFPPKHGGIQVYLWELWRRLPPRSFAVLTTAHADAERFDAEQPFEVHRLRDRVLWPTRRIRNTVERTARAIGAELVVLDPALPLGLIGPRLATPYAVVVHGAEVTLPGRLPLSRGLLGRVLRGAELVIAAGGYPAEEARRAARADLPTVVVPPGVDTERFRPIDDKAEARRRLGLEPESPLVVSVSRLVPRKGMDVLIAAAGRLARTRSGLRVVIAGDGRDLGRLRRLAARRHAPVSFLGSVSHADLPDVYACADVFAMLCRNRWLGLEQEGFGIVFLEAAACGVPQIAGASGGAAEAVLDGSTGRVVARPRDVEAVAAALEWALDDVERGGTAAHASRSRAVAEFDYDVLAARLGSALSVQSGDLT